VVTHAAEATAVIDWLDAERTAIDNAAVRS
jgi:hypothetical protein